jgi:hypothetical protein
MSVFPETFSGLFADKFSGGNESGRARFSSWASVVSQLESFSVMNWLFGIGFGYTYLQTFFRMLMDTGLIGLGIFTYVFLKPVVLLSAKEPISLALKTGVAAIFFMFVINVPEPFIPTTWMFLGISYWLLERQWRARSSGRRPAAFSQWAGMKAAPADVPLGVPSSLHR